MITYKHIKNGRTKEKTFDEFIHWVSRWRKKFTTRKFPYEIISCDELLAVEPECKSVLCVINFYEKTRFNHETIHISFRLKVGDDLYEYVVDHYLEPDFKQDYILVLYRKAIGDYVYKYVRGSTTERFYFDSEKRADQDKIELPVKERLSDGEWVKVSLWS